MVYAGFRQDKHHVGLSRDILSYFDRNLVIPRQLGTTQF